MGVKNKTQVTVFEFSGLTDDKLVALFLFVLFLMVYIVVMLGNIGMMAMVRISPSLHTPMYYLLRFLSMVDLFYSSVSVAQTSSLFSLEFCDSNLIDHFYCDIPPLARLSCSKILTCTIVTLVFGGSCCFSSMTIILVSYILIMNSVLRINSAAGRRKAFSTCSSHLMCSTIFYVSVVCAYFHPSSITLKTQEKVSSVFYTVVTPMLNPLIYSLRNQEVKKAIIRLLQKRSHLHI
ncbi:hypothetical protein AB205_0165290 [Aquarana catesbeiana]|uniref:G-protein coupled receptors family 1 profile domain-containing protein n=1 Tax=Aquarana catesbeiana TaxID=8400 RepID=A0A2G9Q7Z7_AQUCT|nr:hypothetical protein AB205_0165290 [Aquarana catesbeiana]